MKLLRTAILFVLLAAALVLRLWCNTVGLPAEYVPDEESKVRTILTLPEHGFTHWESQPSFTYYTLYALYGALSPVKEKLMHWPYLAHRFVGPDGESAYYRWIGRCWMAILSTLTVYFLYRLGKDFHSRAAGLLGATVYAFSPLAIALTHYLKEDTPLALFFVVTMMFCIRIIRRGRKRDLIWAGISAGLAFASKYPGAGAILIVAAAVAIRFRGELSAQPDTSAKVKLFFRRFGHSLLFFLLTFFVVCPTYLNVPVLVQGLYFQSDYIMSGHHDGVQVRPQMYFFSFYLTKSVIPAIGFPAFLIAVAGLIYSVKRWHSIAWVPAGFCIIYLALAEILPSKPYPFYSRYIIPIIPFLCMFAGVALVEFDRRLQRRLSASRAAIVTVCLALVTIVPTAFLSIRFLKEAEPDTRDLARDWLEQNLPQDAAVFLATPRYDVSLDPDRFPQRLLYRRSWPTRVAEYQEEGYEVFAVISSFDYERYFENERSNRKALRAFEMFDQIMDQERKIMSIEPPHRSYGYHNPTVLIYQFAPSTFDNIKKAHEIMEGIAPDEYIEDDSIPDRPPFPERLPHP